jgi:hypothetical protein
MGIRGLATYLKKTVPHTKTAVRWSEFAGKRVAIDCSAILYRARGADLSPVTVIAGLIVAIRSGGAEPIVIFDGSAVSSAKHEVITERREKRAVAHKKMAELTEELQVATELQQSIIQCEISELRQKAPIVLNSEKSSVKRLLYAAGVLFVTATGEADNLISYLNRTGDIAAVVSTDTDMLARGLSALIIPERPDASLLSIVKLSDVLGALCITNEQFLRACVLMGTDYSESRLSPWGAIDAVRKNPNIDVDEEPIRILTGAGDELGSLLSEKQMAKWIAGTPAVEAENIAAFGTEHIWPMSWRRILSRGV